VVSVTSFLLVVLVFGLLFCFSSSLSSTIVVRTAEATKSGTESTKIPQVSIPHAGNVKPMLDTTLLQVKSHFSRAIHALQYGDRLTALLLLKSAHSKLASAQIAKGGTHATSVDIPSIQSVKMSTKNAIQALQSHNVRILPQGLLHLKSADSKLSSILGSSSTMKTV
jgi:hypothetical protein